MASSVGALKGPRHGGANIRVSLMMEQVIDAIGIKATDEQSVDVIHQILNKKFKGCHDGLVYGFGHAVYTLSDPRAEIMRHYCGILAKEKGMTDVFRFYNRFDKLAMKT